MARALPQLSQRDTIVARATAAGVGAIAILRLSGPRSSHILNAVFRPASGTAPEPARLVLGEIHHGAESVDQALAVRWIAPHSFTGEDMVEFHVHGSPTVCDAVLQACLAAGARLAEPGEFSRRACMNGKIDLVQAEAVCDLVSAQTDAARRAALGRLAGGLSARLGSIRQRLLTVTAELEARVDFPEEGLEFSGRGHLAAEVDGAIGEIARLVESARRGRALREGARIVFAGPPNAGKSSLFNALLGFERALVTPHPGTTRDTIEASIDLRGIPLTMVDTAGLRAAPDEIEALGIERTREQLGTADLVLFLVDTPLETSLDAYRAASPHPHLIILGKADLGAAPGVEEASRRFQGAGRQGIIQVSAKTGEGMESLERALLASLGGEGAAESPLVTNRRQQGHLETALRELGPAAEGLATGLAPEFIVVHLTAAMDELDRITGRRSLDEDVLDEIFSRFCLGK